MENEKVVSLEEIAKFLNKDMRIISDAINFLTIKGYLKNLTCFGKDWNLNNKYFLCSRKYSCQFNSTNKYEITSKGIQYIKRKSELKHAIK